MKKKILTLILLLSVPLFLTACKKPSQGSGNTVGTKNSTDEEIISGKFWDLLSKGKNLKCTFQSKSEDGEISGISYVSGNKAKSEISIKVSSEGKTEEINSYTLVDDNKVYMWGSMMPEGMMMNLEDMKAQSEETAQNQRQQQANMQQEFDFKCVRWVVNNSVFKLPNDITFNDYTEYINTMQESAEEMSQGMDQMKEAACKACNSNPNAEARQECRESLSCE